ncbi:unnamed protein product [Caenorhabditis auriculariae]|uniref:Apple domain-containing protein n=1 Tax=Caenorhabditis auriculariae TaxID=2777116 RepID=A0A8S1GZQ7_9PELO|nr:unnamed protein product [Caenorhabditis auriculariae]
MTSGLNFVERRNSTSEGPVSERDVVTRAEPVPLAGRGRTPEGPFQTTDVAKQAVGYDDGGRAFASADITPFSHRLGGEALSVPPTYLHSSVIMYPTIIAGLLMMQVGQAVFSSCFFLPNMNLEGGTFEEFPTQHIRDCCVRCADIPCCIAYTFNQSENRCYLKSSIGQSTEDKTHTSGLKSNSHSGKGVKMRNTKIYGDREARVALSNLEECQQYCTTFKIYSWEPTPAQSDEQTGYCSCMTRIKEMKYSHGCFSEIMPHE